jgi:membrane-associated phospholipid phosphatase
MSVRTRLASLSVANRFALTWAVGTVVVFAMYLFFVRTGFGQQIDQAVRWVSGQVEPEVSDPLRGPLGVVSRSSVALGGLAAMGIAWIRRRMWLGFAVGTMVLGANVTTQVLKKVVFERPDLTDGAGLIIDNILPSGHVTATASIAIAFVLVVSYRLRVWVAVVAFLATAFAGVAVVALNTHFPSDAIAAIGVVMAWAGAAGWFVATVGGIETISEGERGRTDTASDVLAAITAAFGAIAITGLLLAAAWERTAGLGASRSTLAFVIASAGIVAFAAVFLLAILSALRGVSLERRH